MGLPFLLFTPPIAAHPARITAMGRHALGSVAADPTGRITAMRRSALGSVATPVARLTMMRRHVLGPPREVEFRNAELTIGLTWLELTRPSDIP
jgi:hypothetical protein